MKALFISLLLLILITPPIQAVQDPCNDPVRVSPDQTIQDFIEDDTCIELESGTYFQTVDLSNKSNVTIRNAPGADVAISGAIEKLTEANNNAWGEKDRTLDVTHKIYDNQGNQIGTESVSLDVYCYNHNFDPFNRNSDDHWEVVRNTISYAADDNLIFTYSQEGFERNHVDIDQGEGGYFTQDEVCVALKDNQDPNTIGLNISLTLPIFAIVGSDHITISGNESGSLTLKDAGQRGGVYISNSTHVTVQGIATLNLFSGVSMSGSSNISIFDTTFVRDHNPGWSWGDVKWRKYSARGNPMEATAVSATGIVSSNSIQISGNTFRGYFDGINFSPKSNPEVHHKIHNNYFISIFDDAIQFDTKNPATTEFFDNVITDTFNGISTVPHDKDTPTYIYGNSIATNKAIKYTNSYDTEPAGKNYHGTVYRYGSPGKFKANTGGNAGPSRNVYLYFNTLYASGDDYTSTTIQNRDISNYIYINNIIYSEQLLVSRTGLLNDNVFYHCNLFFSEQPSDSTYRYWNSESSNAFRNLPDVPAGWQLNRESNPDFSKHGNVVDILYLTLGESSAARQENGMTICNSDSIQGGNWPDGNHKISDWPGMSELSSRTSVGAVEYIDDDTLPPQCPNNPDINRDDSVDIYDFSQLITDFAKPVDPGNPDDDDYPLYANSPDYPQQGHARVTSDITCDGEVNIFDFSVLISEFGT